jgi:ketosteroid isomerase-like protein
MSEENVDAVRRIFEAWGSGNWSIGTTHLDRHAVLVISSDFPAFGTYLGLDAIRDYWRDFPAQWEFCAFEATRLRSVGDTVLADVVQHSRGKASGIEGQVPMYILFTFRGGKIVRYECVMNEAEALEAVGLSAQDVHADS